MKELGIYVHIPFCKKKCYYCDFISFENKECLIQEYINALNKEIMQKNNLLDLNYEEYEVTTIYIGGGTPSYINYEYIDEILKNVFKLFNVAKNAEITIEVNPGTASKEKLIKYKQIGINRISIGLQTTNDLLLKKIGRIHNMQDFLDTYNMARKSGFENINVDLMLALPSQELNDLEESLEKTINLSPEHISVYSLIVEEGTPIENMIKENKVKLPSEIEERKMYWKVKQILEENGYKHYEISNFAKKGYESKHNMNCWSQKEYLGFGLAAHSYLNNIRFCNINNLEKYIQNSKKNDFKSSKIICEEQTVESKQKEYMLLGLRKIEGISIQEFKSNFVENPLFLFRKELQKLVNEDLIQIDGDIVKLTNKGLDFANIVWEEFV